MSHRDHRSLIDRGRKAGLNTNELYRALQTRPQEPVDFTHGPTDSNGFQASYDDHGHLIFRPTDPSR